MGNYKEAYLKCIELNNYEDAKKLSENYFKKMIEESKVGDTIYYGKYEQDGNNENGEELIEWIVLGKKDNDILILILIMAWYRIKGNFVIFTRKYMKRG